MKRFLTLALLPLLVTSCDVKIKTEANMQPQENAAANAVSGKKIIGARLQVKAEKVEELLAAAKAVIAASRAEPGNISYTLLQDPYDKTAFFFFEEWKSQQKEIERLKEDLAEARLKTMTADAETINGLKIVVQKMGSADIEALLKAAALLAEQDYVALLGSETGSLVAAVGLSGLEKGVKAGSIIKAAAKALGGGGGGKPDLAQGGGPNVEKLDEALQAGKEAMRAGS